VDLVDSWAEHLRSKRRSPRTIRSYAADVRQFLDHIGHVELVEITARLVDDFMIVGTSRGLSEATSVRRYRSVRQFLSWLVDEGVIEAQPLARSARVPAGAPPAVLTARELATLLGVCDITRIPGRSDRAVRFEARRDTALVLLLITTGVRVSELVGLSIDDVDLDAETIRVVGRAGLVRDIALLHLPSQALGRYLVERAEHGAAASISALWLGEKGPLTASGLRQMLTRRSEAAGLRRITPHDFRRTFAHESLRRGASDESLMAAGGWTTDQMLRRYAPVAT
jgi:site-specific recombinase XerD